MTDYPDWTRLFYLTGTAITIPINIETSSVTLDVNLVTSEVTLDVNITAAAVTIDINFSDQSIAVFDAAKWFAHQGAQWNVSGSSTIASGTGYDTSRVVPADKTAFICGITIGYHDLMDTANISAKLTIAGVTVLYCGFVNGGPVMLDTPLKATTGQTITLTVYNMTTGSKTPRVTCWGYDE